MRFICKVGNSLNPMFSEGQAEALDSAKWRQVILSVYSRIPANHVIERSSSLIPSTS